jgi:hypothetical protein
VQQQIAEFQLLEQQLQQVLQRLQTATPIPHTDGCHCLDGDTPQEQELFHHSSLIPSKGATMPSSTFEPLTILSPSPSDAGCGCGCGASLTQLALPQNDRGHTEDPEHAQPTQS